MSLQPALALLGRVAKATDPVVGAVPRSRRRRHGAVGRRFVRYSAQHACRLGARLGVKSGARMAYRGNRPLTEEEQSQHLSVHDRVEGEVIYQGICTEFNSTYMEVIDKYYGWKGWLSMWMGGLALGVTYWLIEIISISVKRFNTLTELQKQNDLSSFRQLPPQKLL